MKKVLSMGIMAAFAAASSHAAVIASWNFESINGSAATDGQALSGGYFDDGSGNGNNLYSYGTDYSVAQNILGNTTLSADKVASWDGLHTTGDLQFGGSNVGALAQWSIEADVVFASTDLGAYKTVVGKDGYDLGGDVNAAALYLQKINSNLMRINFADTAGNRWILDGTTVTAADTWYTVKAVSDGDTLSLYVNNSLENTLDISGSADSSLVAMQAGPGKNSNYQWTVGRGLYADSHGDKLDGYIDNVTITNIPEPATLGLLGLFGAGLLMFRRRFKS